MPTEKIINGFISNNLPLIRQFRDVHNQAYLYLYDRPQGADEDGELGKYSTPVGYLRVEFRYSVFPLLAVESIDHTHNFLFYDF